MSGEQPESHADREARGEWCDKPWACQECVDSTYADDLEATP